MLWIFDESSRDGRSASLTADAFLSLCRQWMFRPSLGAEEHAHQAAAGAPVFHGLEQRGFGGAFLNGAVITALTFAGILYCCTHGAGHWEGLAEKFYSLESASLSSIDATASDSSTETASDPLAAGDLESLVRRVMTLDLNSDGIISKSERRGFLAEQYNDLLNRADTNHNGEVTEEELRREILWRAE
jgi:hypothetical protein